MSRDLIRGFLIGHNAPIEIMDALEVLKDSEHGVDVLSLPANILAVSSSVNVTVRIINVFKNEKLMTVGDVVKVKDWELLRIPNFGRKSVNEIKLNLKGLGINWGN